MDGADAIRDVGKDGQKANTTCSRQVSRAN